MPRGGIFPVDGSVPPTEGIQPKKAEASGLRATGFGEYISAIKTQLLKGEGLSFGGLGNFLAELIRSLGIGAGIPAGV
jgi:hypothetical protein